MRTNSHNLAVLADTPYVNYWVHSGMVQVNNEKMSKSLNNFFTVREVLKEYDAETLRYFLMSAHYRSQLNYTEDNLVQARNSLERLYTALRDVTVDEALSLADYEYLTAFEAAMNDDFNTPIALSILIRRCESKISQSQKRRPCRGWSIGKYISSIG